MCAWLLGEFYELGTERAIGMKVGPIPSNRIKAAAEGLSVIDAVVFRAVIRLADAEYLGETPPSELNSDNLREMFQ